MKTEQMEKNVRVAEREYSKKMADLNRNFDVCYRFAMQVLLLFIAKRSGCWEHVYWYGEQNE